MNFKAWNMKKGLKRFWIVGSVFWFVFPFFTEGKIFGIRIDRLYNRYPTAISGTTDMEELLGIATYLVVSIGLWWALLYLGFWIARGFVGDDDKKAGF